MKSRIPDLVVAILAAAAIQQVLAQSQDPPSQATQQQASADDASTEAPTVPYVPPWIPKDAAVPASHREGGRNLTPGEPLAYVAEPAASASKTTGMDGELAAGIAQEISADPAMKDAKITVQPIEDNKILLTGSAQTREQVERAGEIATNHAGKGLVVNTVLDIKT
jgi:hypothetical protein